MSRFKLISADSHVVEPPDLWLKYIEPRFRQRAPHLVRKEATDVFECEGVTIAGPGSGASAGVPSDRLIREGRFEDLVPRAAWDPHARFQAMQTDGVEAEVLYPTTTLRMYSIQDEELQHACFQAYNNWVVEYCSAYPDRLKAIGVISLQRIDAGIEELKRCKGLGMVGGMISISPDDERTYDSPLYDAFWAAAVELDMPISLHIVTDRRDILRMKRTIADLCTGHLQIQRSLALMIFGGVFERFPRLKVVSAENDVGWALHFAEHMDFRFDRAQTLYQHQMKLSRKTLPSEFFSRHVVMTFMRDSSWVPARGRLNIDNIMWASDYPHTDSTWPESQRIITSIFEEVPESEKRKVLVDNAARLYGLA